MPLKPLLLAQPTGQAHQRADQVYSSTIAIAMLVASITTDCKSIFNHKPSGNCYGSNGNNTCSNGNNVIST